MTCARAGEPKGADAKAGEARGGGGAADSHPSEAGELNRDHAARRARPTSPVTSIGATTAILSVVNAVGSITEQQRVFRKLVSQHLEISADDEQLDDLS